jgi:sorting nexin-1/2
LFVNIPCPADEYARLINSVRLAFNGRIRTYNAWQSADAEVRRVKSTHEKNRAAGKIQPERMGWSLNQVAEAERKAMEAKQEFDHCSRLIKQEVARFEQERIEDFKHSLQTFLEGMVTRQKEVRLESGRSHGLV